jgi:hypothetical protein
MWCDKEKSFWWKKVWKSHDTDPLREVFTGLELKFLNKMLNTAVLKYLDMSNREFYRFLIAIKILLENCFLC